MTYHESTIAEVRQLFKEEKYWGWANDMFIGGNDDMIAMRFHKGLDYEPHSRKIWRQICKDKTIVCDIGSHSGIFALDAYKAGAILVFAAEPHPINYSRLVLNVRKNGFDPSACFYGAISDEVTVEFLGVGNLTWCHAAGSLGEDRKIKIPVRVMTLDRLVGEVGWEHVGAVKIDAEGRTPNVLRGMKNILQYKPPLIVECIEEGMGEILKPYGYRFWKIWEDGRLEEEDDLRPYNPGNNYNGTDEDCRNRFCSVRELET